MKNIKLEKGIIIQMLPFRLGSDFAINSVNIEDDIWTKTDEDIPKLDFLLEHVKAFFSKNAQSEKEDDSVCVIMKLKKDALPVKMFNNKTYWLSNKSFENQEKAKNVLAFPVNIDPVGFRLIFHPSARVAVLLFSIEIARSGKNAEQPDLDDFIKMNYLLRLFNRHNEAYFISQNERTEERSKALQLLTDNSSDLFNKSDQGNIEQTGWRPRQLINFLLNGLNKKFKVEFFDYNRFTPVCYVQPTDEITDEDMISRTLFFLRKVYDFDYTPTAGSLHEAKELIHPFRQIYYATSLEGAVVLNNCGPSDPEFIKAFYSNSFQKSVWLYILGVLQRSIFLQLMKEVSDLDPDDQQKVKEYLKRYTFIALKAIFSKVSVYHQHNDYYSLIIHNLQINELQAELKDELHELNNLQRQFHEDEVEKNDEIEKQYDKRLNMILFVLSVLSLTSLIYTVFGNETMSLFQHSLAFGIPLILGFIFWKMLAIRKK
jgi:hypothetical protein